MIEILSTGLPNTVQDEGRPGYLDAGVSLCGAMDRPALLAANALLNNKPSSAVIEVALFPFRLRFQAEMSFAVTGAVAPATLDGVPLPPWWTGHAKAGQELRIDPPARGARVVVAFAGGIDVPLVLGSRATDAKGGFGGLNGRGLKRGDRLAVGDAPAMRAREFGTVPDWLHEDWQVLRVLPAAEFDAFDADSLDRFFGEEWTVSADANRQGYRLDGGRLVRTTPRELFSHGIVPGTVQVPASGMPIIQLADANTCGGYPKIATVIEADLWKLAQAPVGAKLRFQEVTRAEGIAALRAQRDGLVRLREAVTLARR
ncbi:biotin-dependent carboxyltransferase family protein [Mesorhizobium sp. RP14(2022)]|uniref:Biotin-dependent carboxyltransferase family protein n=1 Tax=Mesorhizobium liriopis TaxID=2953882 RepID=A0ABT1C390_9HYPH|nr:biotin-dependent carboxyltransferase family protein [Mesorhizobium liriopis]